MRCGRSRESRDRKNHFHRMRMKIIQEFLVILGLLGALTAGVAGPPAVIHFLWPRVGLGGAVVVEIIVMFIVIICHGVGHRFLGDGH